jgi:hypothetical protein
MSKRPCPLLIWSISTSAEPFGITFPRQAFQYLTRTVRLLATNAPESGLETF